MDWPNIQLVYIYRWHGICDPLSLFIINSYFSGFVLCNLLRYIVLRIITLTAVYIHNNEKSDNISKEERSQARQKHTHTHSTVRIEETVVN